MICGIDEAGRGPLAGPVIAAAVILPKNFPVALLEDSKKLSEKKRLIAEQEIRKNACWGIGAAGWKTIDAINILQASLTAMERAFCAVRRKLPAWRIAQGIAATEDLTEIIIDGNKIPGIEGNVRAVVKADAVFEEVMAASILAKNCRDRIMIAFDKKYPAYGYAKHKGYPTKAHRAVCREIGPSPIQRLTFSY